MRYLLTHRAQHHLQRCLLTTALFTACLMVTACDAVPPSVVSTATAPLSLTGPTPTQGRVERGQVFEFEDYTNPTWGYRVRVPVGAKATEADNGRRVVFEYEDTNIIGGRWTQDIEVVPLEEIETRSPKELLRARTTGMANPSSIESTRVLGSKLTGATVSYDLEGGKHCVPLRATMAAFMDEKTAYLIRVVPDAPDYCSTREFGPPSDAPMEVVTSLTVPKEDE